MAYYRPQTKFAKVMFLQVSVLGGGVHVAGRCVCGGGACMKGGFAWQGACMAGCVHGSGACVAGGMCGGWHVWQGACMARGMHGGGNAWQGACMAVGHVWQEGMHGRRVCMERGCG